MHTQKINALDFKMFERQCEFLNSLETSLFPSVHLKTQISIISLENIEFNNDKLPIMYYIFQLTTTNLKYLRYQLAIATYIHS